MTYKCLECGHIFEEGEEARWTEAHGEKMTGCPFCKNAYDEAERCNMCASAFLPDELIGGYCLDCLRETITYEDAFDYMKDRNIFQNFMFEVWYDATEPRYVSPALAATMEELFRRARANDLLCEKTDLLDACRRYILDSDGYCGQDDFVKWREGRK